MSQVVFVVEPESHTGTRWHIRQSGSIRATYDSRAQAIVDARQLAAFENELRGRSAIVRVFDARRRIMEDLVSDLARPLHAAPAVPEHAARRGGTKFLLR
ncbi:MAG TPA: hypothetical protein VKB52_17090 [Rhodanobacteraceae bacterium]|nr:hypothetical protein [Rhodanobacteraceae bacterium]